MGMLVTLHLISVNVYNSISAPPDRGFSYIELWIVGMQLPIFMALVEYSIILGFKKFWNKDNAILYVNGDYLTYGFSSNNKTKEMKRRKNENDLIFKKIDRISLILSMVYFIVFCLYYWCFL